METHIARLSGEFAKEGKKDMERLEGRSWKVESAEMHGTLKNEVERLEDGAGR